MAFFTKNKLSESAFGKGIKVGAVSYKFPTLIHQVSCGEKNVEEVHLWAHNESDSSVKLYLWEKLVTKYIKPWRNVLIILATTSQC